MLKVVFDTNIYISGILYGGKPREGMELARKGAFRLCASQEILQELQEELLDPPFSLSGREVRKIVSNVRNYVRIISAPRMVKECRDSKDNILLDCAVTSKARYLVTGDKDLLILTRFGSTEILKIATFLDLSPWS
jgi:uncharacterized protein